MRYFVAGEGSIKSQMTLFLFLIIAIVARFLKPYVSEDLSPRLIRNAELVSLVATYINQRNDYAKT